MTLEIPKDHQTDQRVNFNGDSTNPHPHDNGANNSFSNHTTAGDSGYARLPRKRPWGPPSDQLDNPCHAKVYVAPVPRTASEADIRLVFEGHGTIVEVVLLRDKRTGERQGSCFVKYSTPNEADRAIKALSNQYTFPGEAYPVVVRFADRDRERLGVRGFCRNMEKKDPPEGVRGFCRNMEKKDPPEEVLLDKVFVANINKGALRCDIEEIFSPYGHIEDVFIPQSRGYGFVKFSTREMALAAIQGLNGIFTMRGCNWPLSVRFADPKKPKTSESRGNYLPANGNFGPCSQGPAVWPPANFCDSNTGGSIAHTASHHSTLPHPQVAAHMPNWEPDATVVHPPFLPHQPNSQLAPMPLQSVQAPNLPSQPFSTAVQRQFHPADSLVQNIEQRLNSQLSIQTESNPSTVAGSTPPDLPTNPQDEDFPECDWSEHYCPDGDKYYYNCVTCESRWEKPEEYALYEKESEKQHEQEDNSFLHPQEVTQSKQETNHDHRQSETSPVVGQV